MAQQRMLKIGRKPPSHFAKAKVLGFFKTWHVWLLTPRKSSVPFRFEPTILMFFAVYILVSAGFARSREADQLTSREVQ